jgi:hypothetical protein
MSGLTRILRLSSLAAVLLQIGCTCGSGPYDGDYFDGDRPATLAGTKFAESDKGDPKVVGCADGQREAFADVAKNPKIAGCFANWTGTKSMRDKPTGKACGDDGEACASPADACAAGWHVCGMDGKGDDIADRTNAKDCDNAGPGRFNAAISHSPTDEINPCPTIRKGLNLPCVQAGLGSEPVCCGNDCLGGKCKDAVWKGKTRISRGTSEGCGAVTSEHNGGLLCCKDADAPAGDVKAGEPTGDAKAGEPTGDAKAGEPTGDAKAGDTKAGDAKAADAKAGDAKTGDAKTETKPAGDAKKPEK